MALKMLRVALSKVSLYVHGLAALRQTIARTVHAADSAGDDGPSSTICEFRRIWAFESVFSALGSVVEVEVCKHRGNHHPDAVVCQMPTNADSVNKV